MSTKRTNCYAILLALLLSMVSTSIHAEKQALPKPNGNNNGVSVILNSQNFPDDAFRAYISSITGVAEGGTLSENALLSVRSISVYRKGITSLQGIEYFTALSILRCYDNHLTSLDVSNNTALTKLDCGNNQITSLDVSNNTALTELYCYNNQLTNLVIENNTALTNLNCSVNELTNLDVSKNTNLTQLSCSNNKLTSLDLSENTTLHYLYCQYNRLLSLDLSACISLISSNLSYQGGLLYAYQVSSNKYIITIPTDLDISKISEFMIDDVDTTPNASNNLLIITSTSAPKIITYNYDIGHNNEKMPIQCSIAQRGESDFILLNSTYFPESKFRNIISEITGVVPNGVLTHEIRQAVTEIVFHTEHIDEFDNLNGIEYFPSLKLLNLSSNHVCSVDVSQNIELEEIYCENCNLRNISLPNSTLLTTLHCHNNQLTNLNVTQNTALTNLDCSKNQLTSLDVTKNTALTYLDCSNNQLTNLNMSSNTVLTYLDCSKNLLVNLNVLNNPALNQLYSNKNQLESLDVSKNTALVVLWCSDNQLTNLDITKCQDLKYLSCYKNHLYNIDISKNNSIESLYCNDNELTSINVTNNTTLKSLSFENNQINSIDLTHNPALVFLSCYNNLLSNLDLTNNIVLNRLYCHNNLLKTLDLSNCLDLYAHTIYQTIPSTIMSVGSNIYSINIPQNFDLTKLSNFKVNGIAATPSLLNSILTFTVPFLPQKVVYYYNTDNENVGEMNVTLNITGIESTNENTVYMDNVEVLAGTENTLSVKMRNTVPIEGFEFDMYLPEGVTVVMDEDGFPEASLSTERTTPRKTNIFDAIMQTDGSLHVFATSTNGSTISGNDGEIVTVKVIANETMEEDKYFIVLKDIAVSDANATSHKTELTASTMTVSYGILGDANTDKRVDVGDYTATAHHILGNTPNPFNMKAANANQDNAIDVGDLTAIAHIILYGSVTIPQNNANARPRQAIDRQNGTGYPDNYVYISPVSVSAGTEYTLSVNMKNDVDAEGFEFDLYLPEGMSFVVDADRFPDASLSTARTTSRKTNTFDAVIQPDGALRVLAASSNASVIDGHDGEVALVKIRVDEGLIADTYTMLLKNIAIADVDAVSHYTEELDAIVTVMTGAPTFVDGIGSEDYGNHEFYNLSGQRIDKPTQPGIYIQQGKKVVIKRVK